MQSRILRGFSLCALLAVPWLVFPAALSAQEAFPLEQQSRPGKQGKETCGIHTPCGPDGSDGSQKQTGAKTASLPRNASSGICLDFFYKPVCPHCAALGKYLDTHTAKYPDLQIHKHDVMEAMELYSGLLSAYQVAEADQGQVPTVFVGDHYCVGEKSCKEVLESFLAACSENGCSCREPGEKSFLELTMIGVASLAAVDAINVCALAVLIILITAVLTRFPGQRKKALYASLAFISAIFTAYFVTGLLIVSGLKFLRGLGSLDVGWIFKAIGVIAILLGLFNLKDFVKYGAGGFKLEVPERWRPAMKKFLGSVTSTAGAFVIGLIVSLFLVPCAIGPYFVAGSLLSGLSFVAAVPWLVLYNLVFVLPMLIIAFLIYLGFASIKNIEAWRQRNLRRLHLVAGVVLFLVGLGLVTGVFL